MREDAKSARYLRLWSLALRTWEPKDEIKTIKIPKEGLYNGRENLPRWRRKDTRITESRGDASRLLQDQRMLGTGARCDERESNSMILSSSQSPVSVNVLVCWILLYNISWFISPCILNLAYKISTEKMLNNYLPLFITIIFLCKHICFRYKFYSKVSAERISRVRARSHHLFSSCKAKRPAGIPKGMKYPV